MRSSFTYSLEFIPEITIQQIKHNNNPFTLINLYLLNLIGKILPLHLREFPLVHNRITHNVLINQIVRLANRLNLLVLVLVDVFEKVELGQERLILNLNLLKLQYNPFLGLDFTLIQHNPGILIQLLDLHHRPLCRLLLLLIVREYPRIDILNAFDLPLNLPLHNLNIPFQLIMNLINRHHLVILMIELIKDATRTQQLLLGLTVNWDVRIVL